MWVNVDEPRNGRLMEYFRVRDFEAPLVRMVNLTDHVTYHLPSDTLDVETIRRFCRSYLEGEAKVTVCCTLLRCVMPRPGINASVNAAGQDAERAAT